MSPEIEDFSFDEAKRIKLTGLAIMLIRIDRENILDTSTNPAECHKIGLWLRYASDLHREETGQEAFNFPIEEFARTIICANKITLQAAAFVIETPQDRFTAEELDDYRYSSRVAKERFNEHIDENEIRQRLTMAAERTIFFDNDLMKVDKKILDKNFEFFREKKWLFPYEIAEILQRRFEEQGCEFVVNCFDSLAEEPENFTAWKDRQLAIYELTEMFFTHNEIRKKAISPRDYTLQIAAKLKRENFAKRVESNPEDFQGQEDMAILINKILFWTSGEKGKIIYELGISSDLMIKLFRGSLFNPLSLELKQAAETVFGEQFTIGKHGDYLKATKGYARRLKREVIGALKRLAKEPEAGRGGGMVVGVETMKFHWDSISTIKELTKDLNICLRKRLIGQALKGYYLINKDSIGMSFEEYINIFQLQNFF